MQRPVKTLLICHHDEPLNRIGAARWLASFSQLVGIVEIREPAPRKWRRVRRELRRVGALRFLDVLAYRLFHRLVLAPADGAWEARELERLGSAYPALSPGIPVLDTASPNSPEVAVFIRQHAPDIVLARCKSLLRKELFTLATRGTFVLHPGVCPEYRNAHGCFWALAAGDLAKVGATLLQIDEGVDTGPVYGYFSYAYDELTESPFVIQSRVVFENLDAIGNTLLAVAEGRAARIDTSNRASGTWGQPWLTKYLRWRQRARRRRRESAFAPLS